jgi:hypothetical protein
MRVRYTTEYQGYTLKLYFNKSKPVALLEVYNSNGARAYSYRETDFSGLWIDFWQADLHSKALCLWNFLVPITPYYKNQ